MSQAQLDTVRRYLACLNAGDTEGLIACFEADGQVISPFLGTMKPRPFFTKLAEASGPSSITPIDLFHGVQPDGASERVAAYFRYHWTLKDGRKVPFTCVDVFEFAPGSDRIRTMNIVYDTHPIRMDVGDKYR